MFRPLPPYPIYTPTPRWHETWFRLIAPLTLWIYVSMTIRYGYFGKSNLVLGPNSSRLLKASSIFVEAIQVRDDAKKGLILYGFSEKPELSLESNWTISKDLPVGIYRRRGFSLWLNKGSKIHVNWTVTTTDFNDLSVVLIKGEQHFVTVQPNPIDSVNSSVDNTTYGNGQAEYSINEDDSYYVSVTNMNPRSIIVPMNVDVSSMMYDTTKAKSKCSTINGLCQLKLPFPNTQFVILATPNSEDLDGWYIELSLVARLITYMAILAFVMLVIFLILKNLGACDSETIESTINEEENVRETDPLVPEKTIALTYGTCKEDEEMGTCNSSEDLYDGKICVICYDEPRNCFFIPCGHCATCHDCAQRIMEEGTKVCPICRRYIHKVRKLYNA